MVQAITRKILIWSRQNREKTGGNRTVTSRLTEYIALSYACLENGLVKP
jgi:hypothetical protein